jgi:hypothetical protein
LESQLKRKKTKYKNETIKNLYMARKKNNRLSLYMGIFIAFIMITSMFGVVFYGFSNSNNNIKYNTKH